MTTDFNVKEFYQELQEKGIIFCFSGPVSQDVIEGIGETLKQKMELEDAGMNTAQRVFAIFVEQMQNIVNYSAEKIAEVQRSTGDIRAGVLVVGQDEGRFYILCGNKVENADIEPIRQHLEHLRSLDKEELKKLFKERRKAGPGPTSKGAGLGFIDIARKAGSPIEYEFTPIDDDFSFFYIKALT